ncbi:WXG100 family type VII secretion target [Nocardia aurantia]|uniref:WXG100 family type VII secretion target n=1 Tax=Nocardia aurantia TaxID=2585199 RepID=UPI0029E7D4C7|nr:WXG100 family type VII secretion target [Nocardia aurantia]
MPDVVRAVGRSISQAGTELRSALEAVGSEVDSLLESGWSGPAATRFARGWTETRDSGAGILAALADLAETLDSAAGTYEQTEDALTTGISSLTL